MRKLYRQGDVLIEKLDDVPADAVKEKRPKVLVLAHGEATGHAHTVDDVAGLWRAGDGGETIFRLRSAGRVLHQEHAPINLDPGVYRVRRQREYSPEAIRTVGD